MSFLVLGSESLEANESKQDDPAWLGQRHLQSQWNMYSIWTSRRGRGRVERCWRPPLEQRSQSFLLEDHLWHNIDLYTSWLSHPESSCDEKPRSWKYSFIWRDTGNTDFSPSSLFLKSFDFFQCCLTPLVLINILHSLIVTQDIWIRITCLLNREVTRIPVDILNLDRA